MRRWGCFCIIQGCGRGREGLGRAGVGRGEPIRAGSWKSICTTTGG